MGAAITPGRNGQATTSTVTANAKAPGFVEPPLPTLPAAPSISEEAVPDRMTQLMGLATAVLSGQPGAGPNVLDFIRNEEARIRENRLRRDALKTNIALEMRKEATTARENATRRSFDAAEAERAGERLDTRQLRQNVFEGSQQLGRLGAARSNLEFGKAADAAMQVGRLTHDATQQGLTRDVTVSENALDRELQRWKVELGKELTESESNKVRIHAERMAVLNQNFEDTQREKREEFAASMKLSDQIFEGSQRASDRAHTSDENRLNRIFQAAERQLDRKLEVSERKAIAAFDKEMQNDRQRHDKDRQNREIKLRKELQKTSEAGQDRRQGRQIGANKGLQDDQQKFTLERDEIIAGREANQEEARRQTALSIAIADAEGENAQRQFEIDKAETAALETFNEKALAFDHELQTKNVPVSALMQVPGGLELLMLQAGAAGIDPATGVVDQNRLQDQLTRVQTAVVNSNDAALRQLGPDGVEKLYNNIASKVKLIAAAVPENRREEAINSAMQMLTNGRHPAAFQHAPVVGANEEYNPTRSQLGLLPEGPEVGEIISDGVNILVEGFQQGPGRRITVVEQANLAALAERFRDDPLLMAHLDSMYEQAGLKIAEITGQDFEDVERLMRQGLMESLHNGADAIQLRDIIIGD